MSDREILLRWLATAAARLRWNRVAGELGWFACALVALRLLAEVFETLAVPPSVRSALIPLFVIVALAIVGWFRWRLTRRAPLAQAAGVADTRAGLKDEFKSAQWFAQRAPRSALVEVLIARAARTTGTLDARRLFPLGVPHSALAALALAIFTVCLAWFSPRIALPVSDEPMRAEAVARKARMAGESAVELSAVDPASANARMREERGADGSQIEGLKKELETQGDAIKGVISARDAGLAATPLQTSERNSAAAVPRDPSAHPGRDLKLAYAAKPPIEPPRGNPSRGNNAAAEPPAKSEIEPTARVAARLREQAKLEQRKITGQPTQGDVTLNSRLRAVSRRGASMREVAYGEGEAAEAGAQASVSGAASGERTGRSQSGGSEGENPNSSATGEGDDQPVLGERTERLLAQMEKMVFGPMDEPQRRDTEEKFYAATQRRASQVGYENLTWQWRAQRESVLPPSGTPLSYREAVKQYFLSQHARER